MMVFFEAAENDEFAKRRLLHLLSLSWAMLEEDIEILDIQDEKLLRRNALNDESCADTKLFEMGIYEGGVVYPKYVPLMLLSYHAHRRLSQVWSGLCRERV